MNVHPISFSSKKPPLMETVVKYPNGHIMLVSPADPIKPSKQESLKKAAIIGGASLSAVLLFVGLMNRKKVSALIKKIFQKTKPEPTASSLPSAHFTPGAALEKQQQEKAEYIKSIWNEYIHVNPPYKPINKEKNLLGLKALQSYGTREDMLKLHDVYQLSKDSDIMREYAKLVGKVGEPIDALKLIAKVDEERASLYAEEVMEEIMKSLKKLMVDKSEPGEWKNSSYMLYQNFESLEKHKNKTISENAKAIMDRLIQDNPWLLE